MRSVTKIFTFDAAHFLPNHLGKCRDLHGHTYKVEVTIAGPLVKTGSRTGMIVDFGDVSTFWKMNIEPLIDHKCLNDSLFPHESFPPTAEAIAEWIFLLFEDFTNAHDAQLRSVRVWETPTGYATYER